jgi:SAM-dependent methyltransferase
MAPETVSDQQYVFDANTDDAERTRLRLVESWADAATISHLQATGVGTGWRCFEVGAGAGSVARWLAGAVGKSGAVVAADLNPRFLDNVPANVEVRQYDITKDEVEAEAYDLVHSRLLLMHLPDPTAALDRMVAALKPGGWLVSEEADWGLFALEGHPDAAWATALVHDLFARHAEAGVRLPYFGRTLPGLVARLGLEAVDAAGATDVISANDDRTKLYRLTFEALRAVNRAVGASDADLDRLKAVVDSPTVVITGVTIVTTRARKPPAS